MSTIRPFLCVLLLIAAALQARGASFDAARMDRVFDLLESNERLRGSVAIARDGKVGYSRAIALRDGRAKNDRATMFRVGSVTRCSRRR